MARTVQALVHDTSIDPAGNLANPPISERGLLHLRTTDGFRHFLALQADKVMGYAQLEVAPGQSVAELVTAGATTDRGSATDRRSDSIAALLLNAIDKASSDNTLLLWAHGAHSAADRVARATGYRPVRSLLQMRRSLDDLQLPPTQPPSGVVIREFIPGQDDAAWLAVNSRAFADHPEQGTWTAADLKDRLAAPWFNAADFFVAHQSDRAARATGTAPGELLGFHWTKVHTDLAVPAGEVYVLGVDPAAQGMKLGYVLLSTGLNHLKRRGLHTVLLYTDESNTKAVRLYEQLGFTTYSVDTQFARS
jgi:mycothiol synthase